MITNGRVKKRVKASEIDIGRPKRRWKEKVRGRGREEEEEEFAELRCKECVVVFDCSIEVSKTTCLVHV
jgi:hypothetical protein